MSPTKRKIYIEFLNNNKCLLVTPYRSKELELNHDGDLIVDLVTFDQQYGGVAKEDMNFIAYFTKNEDKKTYKSRIYTLVKDKFEKIGEVSLLNNKKQYIATVLEE